jgi:hypothetical protein
LIFYYILNMFLYTLFCALVAIVGAQSKLRSPATTGKYKYLAV